MLRRFAWFLVVILVLLTLLPLQAQSPVVYGVFFYSPTCPHCHEVMTNYWPQVEREFGDQLQVLFVDITTLSGSSLMDQARSDMKIAASGVPMLIIGNRVLVGSIDIPAQTRAIVQAGLASGGIAYPPITNIGAWFEGEFGAAASADVARTTSPSFTSDLFANSIAVVVLVALLISLFVFIVGMTNGTVREFALGGISYFFVLATSGFGMLLAASVLLGELHSMFVQIIAACIALVLGAIFLIMFVQPMRAPKLSWLPPVLMIVGLFVAGYLAYIEVTASDAMCGAVGNCNVVQQSEYAKIFGIPIGVLGIVGYGVMLITWFASQTTDNTALFGKILLGLAVFGVAFSVYLTFLEPFVIGATCVWCLLSATLMLLLLWVAEGMVWEANNQQKLAPEKIRQKV